MASLDQLTKDITASIEKLYHAQNLLNIIQFQKTRHEFKGDITLVVFPLLKFSKKKPEETGKEVGVLLRNEVKGIKDFNVVKGFLNIELTHEFWLDILKN